MNLKDDLIEIICSVEGIRYFKNSWGIIQVSINEVLQGVPHTDRYNEIILKGNMPNVTLRDIYHVVAEYVEDPKWGPQYNVVRMYSEIIFDENDSDGKKKFLTSLFTAKQIDGLYNTLNDPYKALDEADAASLVKVKGIGMITAIDMINHFKTKKHLGRIFSELSQYNLTNAIVEKMMARYNSPEVIIEKVKNNPYILADEVDGIGWAKADKIAREGGIEEYDPRRIAAFITKYLKSRGESGQSYVTTDELLGAILEGLGDDTPDANITEAIMSIKNSLWYNEDKTEIGLLSYYKIEKKVAEELIRLRDAPSVIDSKDWKDWNKKLHELEIKQGWEFTDEQKKGICLALSQNVVLITGMAGTGKSSLVAGILEVLKKYSFVQCALSGRAASRLSEITGKEGFTIHRLLGYPCYKDGKQLFEYHDDNPLWYNIYILDEVSMINTELFYYLLRAIPSGAKLICLGDHGQLEAIGSGNLAHDMVNSPEIGTVVLTKIHRQAERSGIISEALKLRRGQQIIEKDQVVDKKCGELQDLRLVTYSDISNSYYKIMAAFSEAMNQPGFNIMKTQVIVPVKSKGAACTYELNNALQELINPTDKRKKEIPLYTDGRPYVLREGDKIINTRNNYNLDPVVYNGNIGIIKTINLDDDKIYAEFNGIGIVEIPHYVKSENCWAGLELGYAITVHKSQGSQWEHVIVSVDFSGYSLLTRELLYTAITRAQKKCDLIAQTNALRYATVNEAISKKATHLCRLLEEVAHPKLVF